MVAHPGRGPTRSVSAARPSDPGRPVRGWTGEPSGSAAAPRGYRRLMVKATLGGCFPESESSIPAAVSGPPQAWTSSMFVALLRATRCSLTEMQRRDGTSPGGARSFRI